MFFHKRGNVSADAITSYKSQVKTNNWFAKNVLQAIIIIGVCLPKKLMGNADSTYTHNWLALSDQRA